MPQWPAGLGSRRPKEQQEGGGGEAGVSSPSSEWALLPTSGSNMLLYVPAHLISQNWAVSGQSTYCSGEQGGAGISGSINSCYVCLGTILSRWGEACSSNYSYMLSSLLCICARVFCFGIVHTWLCICWLNNVCNHRLYYLCQRQ